MRVFVLTGAGISAESGLGTFRDTDGIWARFDPMKLATPEAFAHDPRTVQRFYDMRRHNLLAGEPNAAHAALARLEAGLAARGDELVLVTQNVDDLHERAGSRRVVHMHGELRRARCVACDGAGPRDEDLEGAACPACGGVGTLRPDVVWFGEMPLHMPLIDEALQSARLFVAMGTSGAVYPAAGFVQDARLLGIPTLELNLQPSDRAGLFDDARYGPATEVVPAWVEEMLR